MSNISYTAVILTEKSHHDLLQHLGVGQGLEMAGWKILAHHMTINMGEISKGPAADIPIGQQVILIVSTIAENDKVIAVGVNTDIPSTNEIKHITIAVNRGQGGKPFMSNQLTNWKPISSMKLYGTVQEVAI